MIRMTWIFCLLLPGWLLACETPPEVERLQQARQLLAEYPLIDTHVDVPYRLNAKWADVTQATDHGDFDLPRAQAGGLRVPFMSIYTPPSLETSGGGWQLANQLIDGVEALAARAPQHFMMVHSSADVQTAHEQGKIGLALGMENGGPIEGKLENIAHFAERGVRYITLAHSVSNHLSDSSFDEERPWDGLSPFGELAVAEMNRQGVMVDVSHLSDAAIRDVLAISKVPVLASHSSARHFTPGFERNLSDELIQGIAAAGGVVQINFGSAFVTEAANGWLVRYRAENAEYLAANDFASGSAEDRVFRSAFVEANPVPFATLEQVVDHFDHVIALVGSEYVGIGSDYDGVGDSLPVGLKDVSAYPALVAEFLRRGYTEQAIAGIVGGNVLRVWRANETWAAAH